VLSGYSGPISVLRACEGRGPLTVVRMDGHVGWTRTSSPPVTSDATVSNRQSMPFPMADCIAAIDCDELDSALMPNSFREISRESRHQLIRMHLHPEFGGLRSNGAVDHDQYA
jgi:hypothetical protein